MRFRGLIKFAAIALTTASILLGLCVAGYLKFLPKAVSNPKSLSEIESLLSKTLDADVKIYSPELKTEWSPNVYLKVKSFTINKDNKNLVNIANAETELSFAKILKKNITIKKINADYIYADISSLLNLPVFKQKDENKDKEGFNVDIFKSVANIKKARIFYQIDKENSVDVKGKNIKISNDEIRKTVSYDLNINLCRDKKFCLPIATSEKGNKTYILDKEKLFLENSNLKIDNSNVLLNGNVDFTGNYDLKFKGTNFSVVNLMEILDTQVVKNNLEDYFAYFKDISGNFDFDVDIDNKNIDGLVKLNNLSFKLIPLENLPILLNRGDVKFDNEKITLKNFKGFYNNRTDNKMDFEGSVKDYLKSVDMDLVGNAVITNDFSANYLSKLISYPIGIDGKADTRVMLKSKNNKMDITWLYKFEKGTGFIFDGEKSDVNRIAHRVLVAKMHFENMLLAVKSLDYHFVNPNWKRDNSREPIISMKGNVDFSDGKQNVKDFGIKLTKPMPSFFINLLARKRIFRGGTFTGYMNFINTGKYPVLEGNLKAEKVSVPSHGLLINSGEFRADKDLLFIKTDGGMKHTNFSIDAEIENRLDFPIIIKDADLTVDNVDVEKHLQAFNALGQNKTSDNNLKKDDETEEFDITNLLVEKCTINIKKGNYKGLYFSDVTGNLAFDKNGVLTLNSNRFDIAEGKAEAKSVCDLINHKYNLSLAVIGVNSDIIASELVNLPQEINGKASGLMELNTDETLKLNGTIKFVVQNGIISKMGLVEYTMKVAALFRNPVVMITPAVVSDLVDIPEGKFDNITGTLTLERNVVRRMVIKSVSPRLSTYITGRYNLHNQDAILRIYTRFSNKGHGAMGFLRSISLNTLANRIPLSSKNSSNYYASEISELPRIEADDKDTQIFLTTVDGDIVTNNFLSSLKKLK